MIEVPGWELESHLCRRIQYSGNNTPNVAIADKRQIELIAYLRTGSPWASYNERYCKAAMRDIAKHTFLTRRQILASGVAMAGASPFLQIARATAAPEIRPAKLRLTAGTR